MNLAKLFDMQKELGKVGLFAYKGEDRFNKLVLALLVELGECANEWRGFKFWSLNQKPQTHVPVEMIDGIWLDKMQFKNPLLEEYVDGLHFFLEIGIELGFNYKYFDVNDNEQYDDIEAQFIWLINTSSQLFAWNNLETYELAFAEFFGLGEMLGFTWEQIEAAYMDKNKVNHQRQEQGY